MLRAALDPHMVSVIPNAVITDNFRPAPYRTTPPEQSNVFMMGLMGSYDCGYITVVLQ